MQDLSIFSLEGGFFFSILLKISKEGIWYFISFILIVIDLKIILEQLLDTSNLPRAQAFYIYKIAKIIVVHKKNDFYTYNLLNSDAKF